MAAVSRVSASARNPDGASESGQAVIELAVTLPLLLVVVMGIFDFGLMFQRYEVVTNAAREGARVGVLPTYSTDDAKARAQQYLTSGGLTGGATIDAAVAAVTFGSPAKSVDQITVTVQYVHNYVFIGPILNLFGGSLGNVTLKGVSTMRLEGN
jgi:Flp pilus assembly protein TadG